MFSFTCGDLTLSERIFNESSGNQANNIPGGVRVLQQSLQREVVRASQMHCIASKFVSSFLGIQAADKALISLSEAESSRV